MGRMKLLLRTSHLLLVVVATILSSSVLGSFLNDPKDEASSSSPGSVILPGRVRQISWKPRAFIYSGFLTDEECDHLISLAKSELRRSAVADNVSGETKLSDVRTSSGMFISKGKVCPCNKLYVSEVECRSGMGSLNLFFLPERVSDPIVSGIEGKIAAWTFLPKENGEDIQVLRYEHGQKYDPHYDYFSDKVNIARGGHRIATVLMYLTDVEKGGETVFPSAEDNGRRRGHIVDDGLSDCAKKGIAVKPKKGDALLFFSLRPNVVPDERSLHAGCPVIEGEKWSATKWIHVASFDKSVGGSSGCVDENEYCERWAALGECTNNPDYMVGSPDAPGACRRSCEVC